MTIADVYVSPDGVCGCCDRRDGVTSGGCMHCNSVRTLCGCGAILRCGCGRTTTDHECPSVISSSGTMIVAGVTVSIASILREVEVPW